MSVTIKSAPAAVTPTPGGFTAIASTPDLDRDGEVIDSGAFLPLPKAVPLLAFHDRNDPIGVCRPRYDGNRLLVEATFASTARAQEVRQLVKEGAVTSVSVGMLVANRVKDKAGVVHITRAELLEVSIVSIPSNRAALITEQRAAKLKRAPAITIPKDELPLLRADIALARAAMQSERPVAPDDPYIRSGFTPNLARVQKGRNR